MGVLFGGFCLRDLEELIDVVLSIFLISQQIYPFISYPCSFSPVFLLLPSELLS
jgi:hypothetical protein